MKLRKIQKRAAMEMSVSTIVIIVIAVTMLILGIVLVRNIMCSAMSLTTDINANVKKEIASLFSSGGEVVCIGSGANAIPMTIGDTNTVMCGIEATKATDYKISLVEISATDSDGDEVKNIEKWIVDSKSSATLSHPWTGSSNTNDAQNIKKVLRLKIPEGSPEVDLVVTVDIEKDGESMGTQDLDFTVSKVGWLKSSLC
jgi:Tfp pilus assembly major pilin PilA